MNEGSTNNEFITFQPYFIPRTQLPGSYMPPISLSRVYEPKAVAYINPQIVNCKYIKKSLTNGIVGVNKIHVNPNFKGKELKNKERHNPRLTVVENSILNCSSLHTNKKPESQLLDYCQQKNNNIASINSQGQSRMPDHATIKLNSQYKKVNNFKVMKKYKSKYSWSREKHKNDSLLIRSYNTNNLNSEKAVLATKKIDHRVSTLNCYSHEKIPGMANLNTRNEATKKGCPIYKSETKIINKFKTNLVNNSLSNNKLNYNEINFNSSLKKNIDLLKYMQNKNKKSVVRVANLVKNKYKYRKVSKSIKISKYKIDKRKNVYECTQEKHNLKKLPDIRKLFPCNFSNKFKVDSRYTVSRSVHSNAVLVRNNYYWRRQDKSKITLRKVDCYPNRRVVNIGGIFYKSTTNKLTRALGKKSSSESFRKQEISKNKAKKGHIVYVKGEKFILDKNGKTLRRQKRDDRNNKKSSNTLKRIDIGGVTYVRKSDNILIRTNVHQARHLVKRAKHKSIATLFKLRKRSSMNCMILHKFGRCIRHNKGLCMYKHDPKNIAICKKFLKGSCNRSNCLLSHEVIQEKMATCHFFLNGFCSKENCPYLHVKLNKNASICKNFLQGFCDLGKNCSSRHEYICPDFDKYKRCNLGVKCHYPHKINDKTKKHEEYSSEICNNSKEEPVILKYYTRSHHSFSNIKKEELKNSFMKLKESETQKHVKNALKIIRESSVSDNPDQVKDIIECVPKKVKLEKLPCFIPLATE